MSAAASSSAQPAYDLTLIDAFVPNYALRATYIYDISDQGFAIGTTVGNTPIGTSYVGFTWTASGGIEAPGTAG